MTKARTKMAPRVRYSEVLTSLRSHAVFSDAYHISNIYYKYDNEDSYIDNGHNSKENNATNHVSKAY